MPARRIVLAAVLAGCALCPLRGDALDAHTPIAHPATTPSASVQGLEAVHAACPGMDQAVATLDVDRLLPPGWWKKAGPKRCADLDGLARRYAGRPSSAVPAASDLRTLALALRKPPSSSDSLWKRLTAWLHRRLAPMDGLLKWFRSLPGWNAGPGSRTAVLIGIAALLLLGVAALVFMGLEAAGLIGAARRTFSRRRDRSARMPKAAMAQPGSDAEPMHAADRPVLALRMLMEALRRSRRIERDGGLTCREVVVRALFDTVGQREGFATIALLAERELYGPVGSSTDMPDELRLSAQALYDQLLAAPAAARSAGS